jgi:Activator of Hsp90 ATPase homolog 1-like protein
LAYTWHTFTPQWAACVGLDDQTAAAWRAEPRSHVAFDIEAHGSVTRLTVAHGGFLPGSVVRPAISEGWPAVLSGMKTLLETGAPLR